MIVDGRGKNCAGVIAALTRQTQADGASIVEAIMADALNIYDVITWAEEAGHRIVTQRKDGDGTLRLLIQPFAGALRRVDPGRADASLIPVGVGRNGGQRLR